MIGQLSDLDQVLSKRFGAVFRQVSLIIIVSLIPLSAISQTHKNNGSIDQKIPAERDLSQDTIFYELLFLEKDANKSLNLNNFFDLPYTQAHGNGVIVERESIFDFRKIIYRIKDEPGVQIFRWYVIGAHDGIISEFRIGNIEKGELRILIFPRVLGANTIKQVVTGYTEKFDAESGKIYKQQSFQFDFISKSGDLLPVLTGIPGEHAGIVSNRPKEIWMIVKPYLVNFEKDHEEHKDERSNISALVDQASRQISLQRLNIEIVDIRIQLNKIESQLREHTAERENILPQEKQGARLKKEYSSLKELQNKHEQLIIDYHDSLEKQFILSTEFENSIAPKDTYEILASLKRQLSIITESKDKSGYSDIDRISNIIEELEIIQ